MKREILHREIHKSYEELLKTQEWHDFSKRIKTIHNWECNDCGSKNDLEVHHLGYKSGKKPWEYYDDEVIVLCQLCHSELHEYADRIWNESLKCKNMWVIYECGKAVRALMEKYQRKQNASHPN